MRVLLNRSQRHRRSSNPVQATIPLHPLMVTTPSSGIDLSQNMADRCQSGQAIKLFQAPRKISFTFHFRHKSYILDDVKLAELSDNSSERKNVTYLGVGVKTCSDPSYIFSGGQDTQPPGSTPLAPSVRHVSQISAQTIGRISQAKTLTAVAEPLRNTPATNAACKRVSTTPTHSS